MEATYCATFVEDMDCESNPLRLNSKETNAEARQSMQTNLEDIVEDDVHGDQNYCSASFGDSLIGSELGVLVDSGVHYIQDSHGQFYEHDGTLLGVEVADSGESSTCQESGLPAPCEAKLEKSLSKSATFPSPELEFSHSFCVEESVPSPSTTSSSQDASLDQLSTHKRTVSLPGPVKLVSAMKGGRAQNGTTSKLDLRVKWASDVYDPPGSFLSLMMPTNDHGRPKSKKKDKQRHKHAKGKSVRGGSSSGKKHTNKRHGGGIS